MGAALKFRHADVPRQATERVRLKVIRGAEIGVTYIISGSIAVIGRGEDCDVVVGDIKASRKHAELSFDGQQWSVRDLGSGNGILHNGRVTLLAKLQSGDRFSIGDTHLQFLSSEEGTQVLRQDAGNQQDYLAGQIALNQQRERVHKLAQIGTPTVASAASSQADSQSKRILLIGAVVIIGFVVFFGASDEKNPKSKTKPKGQSLAQFLPQTDIASGASTEAFLKAGFREYRAKNYLRARTQFETVLQITPGHPLAQIYLENCRKAIDEEVRFHLEKGKLNLESGSLKQAKLHYSAVQRLLFRDQANASFIEAHDQLLAVEKAVKTKGAP